VSRQRGSTSHEVAMMMQVTMRRAAIEEFSKNFNYSIPTKWSFLPNGVFYQMDLSWLAARERWKQWMTRDVAFMRFLEAWNALR